MPEFLTATVDKFTFKVATDRVYTSEGLWAIGDGQSVRIGLSDYLQQRSGDVAFAEVKPAGTALAAGDEAAAIETIKVNVSLPSPVKGRVVTVNPALETAPEIINQDPYGDGWLAVIEAEDWPADQARLLTAQAYFDQMKEQAEQDVKKL